MKSPVIVIMKPRRVFARVTDLTSEHHGARIEITGHGRGWDVYAVPAIGGDEFVIRNGTFEYEPRQ